MNYGVGEFWALVDAGARELVDQVRSALRRARAPGDAGAQACAETLEPRLLLAQTALPAWVALDDLPAGLSADESRAAASWVDTADRIAAGTTSEMPTFSPAARWTGKLAAPADGDYELIVVSDDPVRLWLDSVVVVNGWQVATDSARPLSQTVHLTAGTHDAVLEGYELGGSWHAEIRWVPPSKAGGDSADGAGEVTPANPVDGSVDGESGAAGEPAAVDYSLAKCLTDMRASRVPLVKAAMDAQSIDGVPDPATQPTPELSPSPPPSPYGEAGFTLEDDGGGFHMLLGEGQGSAPAPTLTISATSISEGQDVIITCAANDSDSPDADLCYNWTISRAGGDSWNIEDGAPFVVLTPNDGSYTVSVTVSDGENQGSAQTSFSVSAVAPTMTVEIVPGTELVGETIFRFSSIYDPSPDDSAWGYELSLSTSSSGGETFDDVTLPGNCWQWEIREYEGHEGSYEATITGLNGEHRTYDGTFDTPNTPPTVDAGPDIVAWPFRTIHLHAIGHDPGWAFDLDYEWHIYDEDGLNLTLEGQDVNFSLDHWRYGGDEWPIYADVTVSDGLAEAEDQCVITVLPPPNPTNVTYYAEDVEGCRHYRVSWTGSEGIGFTNGAGASLAYEIQIGDETFEAKHGENSYIPKDFLDMTTQVKVRSIIPGWTSEWVNAVWKTPETVDLCIDADDDNHLRQDYSDGNPGDPCHYQEPFGTPGTPACTESEARSEDYTSFLLEIDDAVDANGVPNWAKATPTVTSDVVLSIKAESLYGVTFTFTYDDASAAPSPDEDGVYTPDGHLRLFTPDGTLIVSGTGYSAAALGMERWLVIGPKELEDAPWPMDGRWITTLKLEGVMPGSQTIQVASSLGEESLGSDTIHVTGFAVDMDVDSDHSGAINESYGEDQSELKSPAWVFVNDDDDDQDGIPDFADGFDGDTITDEQLRPDAATPGEDDFVPVLIKFDETTSKMMVKFDFDSPGPWLVGRTPAFDEAPDKTEFQPEQDGVIRLWAGDPEERTLSQCIYPGRWYSAGELEEFGLECLGSSQAEMTLYAEGVSAGTATITVTVDPTGRRYQEYWHSDQVALQVIGLDMDIDGDNNSPLGPDHSAAEEHAEDDPLSFGKIIVVNDRIKVVHDETNNIDNYVPAFACEDWNTDGMAPLEVTIKGSLDPNACIVFEYDMSDLESGGALAVCAGNGIYAAYTAQPGALRIWHEDGGDGVFVKSGTRYALPDLVNGEWSATYYVEAIHAADAVGLDACQTITAWLSPDGSDEPGGWIRIDSVRVLPVQDTHPDTLYNVSLADGTYTVTTADLVSAGYSGLFGHQRTYTTGWMSVLGSTSGLGYLPTMPQIYQAGLNSVVAVINGQAMYFDNGTPRFGSLEALAPSCDGLYWLSEPDGSQWRFYALSEKLGPMSGMFCDYVDPAGNRTVAHYEDGKLTDITRGTPQEKFAYQYYMGGGLDGLISTVTLTRGAQEVEHAAYTYDGSRQLVQVDVSDGQQRLSSTYYRYPAGKFITIGPAAYERMVHDGKTPASALDVDLGVYGDVVDLDTQARQKVSGLHLQGLGDSSSGDLSAVGDRGWSYISSSAAVGLNRWSYKTTVVTRGQTELETIYANYAGQTVLASAPNGENTFWTYDEYDSQGRLVKRHDPGDIASVTQTAGSGPYASDKSSGAAVESWTYGGCGRIDTATVGPVTASYSYVLAGVYRIETVTDLNGNVTDYDYGGVQGALASRQLCYLPAVGDGTAPETSQDCSIYDVFGRLARYTDPCGTVTVYGYDNGTGAITSVTVLGGGSTLTTTYEVDKFGRTTSVTDPTGRTASYVYTDTAAQSTVTYDADASDPDNPRELTIVDRAAGAITRLTRTPDDDDLSKSVDLLDYAGNVVKSTAWPDPQSNQNLLIAEYEYKDGMLYEQTDPSGEVLQIIRDNLGRPTTWYAGGAQVRSVQYDHGGAGNSNITEDNRDYGNPSTEYDYDSLDRPDKITDPDRLITRLTYDNMGHVTFIKLYSSSETLLAQTENTYNARGRQTASKVYAVTGGELGQSLVSLAWYDACGRVIKTQAPNGLFAKTAYDAFGRVAHSYTCYDLAEAASSYADAASLSGDTVVWQQDLTYNNYGQVVSSFTNDDGFHTFIGTWYDGYGRASATVDYGNISGPAWTTQPSSWPQRSSSVIVSETFYSDDGMTVDTADNRGIVSRTVYDGLGRVVQTIENYVPSGQGLDENRTTTWDYRVIRPENGQVRLVDVMTAVNRTSAGDVSQQTWTFYNDPINPTLPTDIVYPDAVGTDVNLTDPNAPEVTGADHVHKTYDHQGRLIALTDQNDTAHTYSYDGASRLLTDCVVRVGSGVDAGVLGVSWLYDPLGCVSKVTTFDTSSGTYVVPDPDSQNGHVVNQVQFDYNGFGELIARREAHAGLVTANTPATTFGYETATVEVGGTESNFRLLDSQTCPGGTVVNYDYSTASPQTNTRISAIFIGQDELVTYAYSHNRVAAMLLGASAVVNDDYDAFGRLADRESAGYSSFDWHIYTYDADGNILSSEDPWSDLSELYHANGVPDAQAYDGLNRLQAFARGALSQDQSGNWQITTPARSQSWSLDACGNWASQTTGSTTITRQFNSSNETTAASSGVQPQYDNAGNAVAMPAPAAPSQQLDCTYDAWNRLVAITDGYETFFAQYQYDGQGHRTATLIWDAETGDWSRTDYYHNGSWQVVEERYAFGLSELQSLSAATAVYCQYVWDIRYVDSPLFRLRDANGFGQGQPDGVLEERLGYFVDGRWNVSALVDLTAGSSAYGEIVERYIYDPYGNMTVLNGTVDKDGQVSDYSLDADGWSDWGNEIGYGGYRLDPETGLWYSRRRYYNSTTGTWAGRDPEPYADGPNLYGYCAGDPIGATDPMGTDMYVSGYGSGVPALSERIPLAAIPATELAREVSETAGLIVSLPDSVVAPSTPTPAGAAAVYEDPYGYRFAMTLAPPTGPADRYNMAFVGWLATRFGEDPLAPITTAYKTFKAGGQDTAGAVAMTIIYTFASAIGVEKIYSAWEGANTLTPTERLNGFERAQLFTEGSAQLIGFVYGGVEVAGGGLGVGPMVDYGVVIDRTIAFEVVDCSPVGAWSEVVGPGSLPKGSMLPPLSEANALSPGPFAMQGLRASGPGSTFTAAERIAIDSFGHEYGCHTCGRMIPLTKSGHWIPDHQPPSALVSPPEQQWLLPQCLQCSRMQGGQVRSR